METTLLIILGIVAVIGGGFLARRGRAARKAEELEALRHKRDALLAKYGDPKVVDNILAGLIWQGATAEMVRDAWGPPVAITEKVLRTKVSHVYKYQPGRRRSYGSRVMLENGIVIGWQQQ
nr:hypothetical protein RAR13_04335 [Aminobacter aminovorans]